MESGPCPGVAFLTCLRITLFTEHLRALFCSIRKRRTLKMYNDHFICYLLYLAGHMGEYLKMVKTSFFNERAVIDEDKT